MRKKKAAVQNTRSTTTHLPTMWNTSNASRDRGGDFFSNNLSIYFVLSNTGSTKSTIMRLIKEKNRGIATVLSFALIPLTGLATDVYLPSLPSMAADLHVSSGAIQNTLLVFLVSTGLSQ